MWPWVTADELRVVKSKEVSEYVRLVNCLSDYLCISVVCMLGWYYV